MGVSVECLCPGDGQTFPKAGQTVVVHYVGMLMNGKKLTHPGTEADLSSLKWAIKRLSRGWEEGVAQMSVGQRARLTCSPDYAYGSTGHPGIIPPNATLIFEVELLKLE